jgi:uncharacterized membrane protein
VGRALSDRLRGPALYALSVFFVVAGANHFLNPDFYLAMMPPWLPLHREAVWVSGVLEIVGGIAVLVPRTRAMAGWGLIALLVAIFPANLHMALNPERYPDFSSTALWARLPVQALFVAWAWWATRADRTTRVALPGS